MTLRQLEVFLAVGRARSFRRAAEALHLSQPALSQHVRELEDELGVRLFDRLGRTVSLTEAGRAVEEHAGRVFATLADARQAVSDLRGLHKGTLTIGASSTPGIYVLPRVLAAFGRQYPAITVSMRLGNSADIERMIRGNELDLGLVGGHVLGSEERCLHSGLVDELVLIVSPSHPWARRREIPTHRLGEAPLLMREVGSATRQVTERALEAAGTRYRVGLVLEHTEAIKQAVMAGLGAAFVSIHAVRGEVATGRLRALRLRGLRLSRHFHLIRNQGRTLSAAAGAFMERLASAPPDPAGQHRA
jgi:DNA-binding transcriptional LysR family regulator